jgi:hypothetical protein
MLQEGPLLQMGAAGALARLTGSNIGTVAGLPSRGLSGRLMMSAWHCASRARVSGIRWKICLKLILNSC